MAKRKRLPGNQAQEVVVELPQVQPVASDRPEVEEVARLAHQYWLDRGSPIGTPEKDWFRAEEEFRLRRQQLEQQRNHR
jgi:hypothetical protein